jgi:GntR family transcriptional repressor for pyruvate dehydrogenase complex
MASESVRQISPVGLLSESREPLTQTPRLGDHLSSRISDLIDRGEFGDEGRLPSELALADRFGVSRPVVREALSRLRSRGVIVSRKGSGSYFRKSLSAPTAVGAVGFLPIDSLAAVRKCFEFRIGVESEAAFFAAQNHAPATLAAIREALERMEAAAANGGVAVKADLEFHLSVARASGNEYFEAMMHSMRTPIEFAINLARSLTLTRPLEHLRTVQTEHVVLFQAIEARDKDAARAAMRRHIENTCKRVFDGPGGSGAPTLDREAAGRG